MCVGDDLIDISETTSVVSNDTYSEAGASGGENAATRARGIIQQNEYLLTVEYDIKDFDCPVCLDILTDPVTILCSTRNTLHNSEKCECIVCQKCAQKLWETNIHRTYPKCMNCSKRWNGDYERNVFLANIVSRIEWPCANKSKGCTFTGTKEASEKHWCPYHETHCPNSDLGCTATLLRKDILSHALKCEYFPCRARYGGSGCDKLATCKNIKQHHCVCDYARSRVLRETINDLNTKGKIYKQNRGVAFGSCNEKQWLQRLKSYSRNGIKFEDFYTQEYVTDVYNSLQVMLAVNPFIG